MSVPGALGGIVSGALIDVFMSAWISLAGEGAVVDADFVDVALEALAPDRVAADPAASPVEVMIVPLNAQLADLGAVDVEPQGRCRRRSSRCASRC